MNNCIQQLITNGGVEGDKRYVAIDEYNYNGKKVFLLTADCCDFLNIIKDDSCNTICAPSGGISGNGDGQCAQFFSKAIHVKQVWKK